MLRREVPLAPLTTYRLGGPAAWFLEASREEELVAVRDAVPPGTPVLVLGRGSNVVISDEGFPGLVVRLVGELAAIHAEADGIVAAGGGVALPRLARFAAERGRGGLEFYVGIPGSVGGAVRMNAGGHGRDTGEVLRSARIVDLDSGVAVTRDAAQLGLAYRHSRLGDREVVVSARFVTSPVAPEVAEARLREITRWRREHQPGGRLNAGSVFKNPPGEAAGRLIDAAGLKGFRRGAVTVSEVHANFFVAEEGATAQDVWDLVREVRRRAKATMCWSANRWW